MVNNLQRDLKPETETTETIHVFCVATKIAIFAFNLPSVVGVLIQIGLDHDVTQETGM